jgi:acyl-CoA thioesterase YciA
VQLEVWAKTLPQDYAIEDHLVTEGLFRYVSIDEQHRPRRIPDNPAFFTRSGSTFELRLED